MKITFDFILSVIFVSWLIFATIKFIESAWNCWIIPLIEFFSDEDEDKVD